VVWYGFPPVQCEALGHPFLVGAHRVGEQPPAQPDEDGDQYHDDRRQVDKEVVERQATSAGDDDVRLVAGQGGGAADVRGEHLGQQVGRHREAQPPAQQDGDRRDQAARW